MSEPTSPAEQYARVRRPPRSTRCCHDFAGLYAFALDDFQVRACREIEEGRGVLVAAPDRLRQDGRRRVRRPPGAGDRPQVLLHHARSRRCPTRSTTTSSQRYGADQVGLLTGDNTVNGEAPVVVMTTEVLRNMLYAGSRTLLGLGFVVMDEVHYLADRIRGAVWEEVIIHLPGVGGAGLAVRDGVQRRGVRRVAARRSAATPPPSWRSAARCRCAST